MNKSHQIVHNHVYIKAWYGEELGFQGTNKTDVLGRLCDDSRLIQHGDTFLCLPRAGNESARFIAQAIRQGASAVVHVGEPIDCDVMMLCLPDMQALGQFLRRYFETENTFTRCIGVTGTDGKTSVAWMLRQALERHLGKAWSSGTLGWMLSLETCHDLGNTTPSLLTMHYLLAAAHQANIPVWVMEVSSHGIEQQRMAGIPIDTAIWTTLGHDHLQDHGGFDNYANLKSTFIHHLMEHGHDVIINAQQTAILKRLHADNWKGYMPKHMPFDAMLINTLQQADMMQWEVIENACLTLTYHNEEVVLHDVPVGQFHAENLAAVAQLLTQQWSMSLSDISACLSVMPAPYGRMEAVKNTQNLQVYVDYAHTPEGLQACLQSARALTDTRLMLVFGCGGNRDVSKRAEMGAVAETFADKVWVTSDNPRDEEPEIIIADILQGLNTQKLRIFVNRADAIADALKTMSKDDVLVIAGKGHENYMEIKGQRTPWHDATWVKQCLDSSGQK
ncbi:MAG: UDP-N-acetylmuramoyl-L-alanyl-D-glutamate--2,6-diaminopimelate ligase [Mariprofundaceae bacterium]|nr:UDP-N-acetylmuramoyl-L-alanyl-D-glutamate--2,6-diaminopimelate ligase [Mariprofundaceae bacterium]